MGFWGFGAGRDLRQQQVAEIVAVEGTEQDQGVWHGQRSLSQCIRSATAGCGKHDQPGATFTDMKVVLA
jgi:hypothetical protein